LHLSQPLNNCLEKRKNKLSGKKFSLRRVNWPNSLLGRIWGKPGPWPALPLQQSGALLAVGCDPTDQRGSRQNKSVHDCGWETLAALSPRPLSSSTDASDRGRSEDDGGRWSGRSSGERWRRRRSPRRCTRSPHRSACRRRAVWLRCPLGAVVFPGTPVSGGR
jgi:hypothetical protein